MNEIAESAFGGDLEPVSPWVTFRCWVLHWWLHRRETDTGTTVRYCPRCRLVVSVEHKGAGDD